MPQSAGSCIYATKELQYFNVDESKILYLAPIAISPLIVQLKYIKMIWSSLNGQDPHADNLHLV